MYWFDRHSCPVREYRSDFVDRLLRVYVLEDGLVRIRYVVGDLFDKWPSYGVSPDYEPRQPEVEEYDILGGYELKTPLLTVKIRKQDLGVEFFETETGIPLCIDEGGLDSSMDPWNGDYATSLRKRIRPSEYFYGLGDKPTDLNLRGKKFRMWGADHYAFKENADPLYKNIPFFVSLFEGVSYGIFLDNTTETFFDFGAGEPDILKFGARGGQMDYYFIHAGTPIDVVAVYTRLTGLPPLPPLWALGYHQSKWSYYPDKAVREVADNMRRHRIPCDSIHLDIHHMDSYRSLTWDSVDFPDPRGLVNYLVERGIKPVTILNPGIKVDPANDIWKAGFEENCFCRRHDGMLMEGIVWPGVCHFPDFTNPCVRDWWVDILKPQLAEIGIRGLWNDMNEPVIFPDRTFPMDTRHFYDGRPCSHGKAHNVYGHCMAAASWEGMMVHGRGNRPFNLSRSGYAGMQRFAATWTGDNCSTWEHVRLADFQCQRLAVSGISFAGSDAGGFLEYPTPELFCRWMQMAAFHGFFRNHSSGEYGGQEPWSFGDEITGYVRFAIEQRYRLLPYFYTQFYRYSSAGLPIVRSLAMQCPGDDDAYWRGVEFFVGEHLYVVPVLHAEARGVAFYVPEGTWYSLWDDEPAGRAKTDVWTQAPLSRTPVYVRGGAVIPRWPVQQYVGQIEKPPLTLDLWWAAGTHCASHLYEDDGEGMAYKDGWFLFHEFEFDSGDGGFSLVCSSQGVGLPFHGGWSLALHALPEDCRELVVIFDGEPEFRVPVEGRCCSVSLPAHFECMKVSFKMEGNS